MNIQDGDEKDLLIDFIYENYPLTLDEVIEVCEKFNFNKIKIEKYLKNERK